MVKVLCDRCGADITGKTLVSHYPGAPIFEISYQRSSSDEEYVDLCQRCNDDLYDWINGVKRVE